MYELLDTADLPADFQYPSEFLRVVDLGLVRLEPWFILMGDLPRRHNQGLRERYPNRHLVPFARGQDNDDIACWDLDQGAGAVVTVHDFASPGWETKAEFSCFDDWLRQAVEDLLSFE